MDRTIEALCDKIQEMYPEIREHRLSTALDFSKEKNAYIVTFRRGRHTLSTHVEKKDAEDCLNNIKCLYLGVQIEQFIKNFDERELFERTAAA